MHLCAYSEQSNINILLMIHPHLTCSAKHLTKMISFAWVPADMGFVGSEERGDLKPNEAPNETLAPADPWHRTPEIISKSAQVAGIAGEQGAKGESFTKLKALAQKTCRL